jgi:hypothetical protein
MKVFPINNRIVLFKRYTNNRLIVKIRTGKNKKIGFLLEKQGKNGYHYRRKGNR